MFTKGQIVRIGLVDFEIVYIAPIDVQYKALLANGWTYQLGLKQGSELFNCFTDGKKFSQPRKL